MLQTGFLKDLEAAGWTRESVESNGESAVITGDLMHHPCQMARTDWRSGFDDDGDTAEKTRHAFLVEMADGPTLVIGTHFATATATGSTSAERDGTSCRFPCSISRQLVENKENKKCAAFCFGPSACPFRSSS